MLGVPSRRRVAEDTEDAVKAKNDSAKTGTASIAKGDSSPG
ncbi:paired amphipathic helix protein Sin3-like 4-like, partial [Trifolium medium]|nr:paired amphipathic helix protein Sin3-like 4-like [Trifolium medium]